MGKKYKERFKKQRACKGKQYWKQDPIVVYYDGTETITEIVNNLICQKKRFKNAGIRFKFDDKFTIPECEQIENEIQKELERRDYGILVLGKRDYYFD